MMFTTIVVLQSSTSYRVQNQMLSAILFTHIIRYPVSLDTHDLHNTSEAVGHEENRAALWWVGIVFVHVCGVQGNDLFD